MSLLRRSTESRNRAAESEAVLRHLLDAHELPPEDDWQVGRSEVVKITGRRPYLRRARMAGGVQVVRAYASATTGRTLALQVLPLTTRTDAVVALAELDRLVDNLGRQTEVAPAKQPIVAGADEVRAHRITLVGQSVNLVLAARQGATLVLGRANGRRGEWTLTELADAVGRQIAKLPARNVRDR